MGSNRDDTLPAKRGLTGNMIGARVRDYIVREVISAGGFGTVYRVEHTVLKRTAALKVLHAELVSSREAIVRFEREARAVNLIRHPNVVDIYDFGELPDGRPYFVMEHLVGSDLGQHLASVGALSLEETVAILAPLCDALAAAHDKGVIHRDVKASNVFLVEGASRRVVLLDFGIAKLVDPAHEGLTTSRHRIGTPSYMAPEQLTGEPVDARTDVYSLGALAYQMLTGELPFGDGSASLMLHMQLSSRRPRPSERVAVPERVDRAVHSALAIEPEQRPASVRALRAALEEGLAESKPQTRASRALTTNAIALYGEARIDTAALEDADDALLADLDAALALAEGAASEGFVPAAQTGTSLLLVRALPADSDTARRDTIAAAIGLAARLDTRSSRDARVRIRLSLHVDQVVIAGDKVRGGPLTQLSKWVPDHDDAGVFATAAVLDGLGLTAQPVPNLANLFRLPPF